MSYQAADLGRVAVLMGGWSAEREISLASGEAVLDALLDSGVDATGIDVDRSLLQQLTSAQFDRAFIALHGRGGEDGVIQGVLELLKLPYTGSGVMGSAISMDKYRTKLIWQALGLQTPGFALLRTEADLDVAEALGLPLIVKPAHEGSSLGMGLAEDRDGLVTAWKAASRFDDLVLAERWIDGPEYTVSIVGDQALPLIKLETPNVFYDYSAKYQSKETQYLIPCGLDSKMEQELQEMALQAFNAVGARGWGRVDLMLDTDDQPWLIEVNTVPGMTDHSLVPMAAQSVGIDFNHLVLDILGQTMEEG